MSTPTALVVVGSVLELVGIVLVGSPDLLPGAQRGSAWLGRRTRKLVDRGLRLIGRPRRRVHTLSLADGIELGGRVTTVVSKGDRASLEEKVAFLLDRDRQTQRDLSDLRAQFEDAEKGWQRQLEQARGEMEDHVAAEIAAAHHEYLAFRIVGAFMLAAGIACVMTAQILG